MNKNVFVFYLAVFLLFVWMVFSVVRRMTDIMLQVPAEQQARTHLRPLSTGPVTMVRTTNSHNGWYPWHSFRGRQGMKWQSNGVFSLQKIGK